MTRNFGSTFLFAVLVACFVPQPMKAAPPAQGPPLFTGSDVDASIPSLDELLGYQWGSEITSHVEIEQYLRALADAAPDRTRLVKYGESYERRGLYYLVVSAAENIRRLDGIQEKNLQLCDPRSTTHDAAEQICRDNPALVWLAYSVHGNECSPSDAAILTAYHLLADRGARTQRWLKDLVVIIDPLQNPDGRERFVQHFRKSRGRFIESKPLGSEHTEPWPGGRSNHYLFDMNRDWFLQSQQETVAKVKAYLQWQPQIYVDAHEMGRNSTYYFSPPTDPVNPFLLAKQTEWLFRIGRHQAKRFDEHGFRYTTREIFDAFFPGYGSEWPILRGGLGILWEQAGVRGLVVDRDDETQLAYEDSVRHHYVSGLATIEVAAQNREMLLGDFYDTQRRAIQLGNDGPAREFFLLRGDRPQRAHRLACVLANNGVEVQVLTDSLRLPARDIRGGSLKDRTLPPGTYRISVAQPAGRLARVLLDRQVDMDEEFVRRQLERKEQYLPDEIYDVTAWSLPLAFGVTCLSSEESINAETKPLSQKPESMGVSSDEPRVAYLIPGTDGAMQALCSWLQDGIRVHVLDRATKLDGRSFDPGTLVVFVRDNAEQTGKVVREAADRYGFAVHSANTGFVDEGAHLGGPYVKWVKPPRVLLPVDRPMSYRVGHTWHLFDQYLRYPTTRVAGRNLPSVDLDEFNVLLLPDGSYSADYGFDAGYAEKVRRWVGQGGTLVLVRGAVRWAMDDNVGLLPTDRLQKPIHAELTSGMKQQAETEEKPSMVSPDSVPGVFLRASVFGEHWITHACRKEMDVFYSGNLILKPLSPTSGRNVVTFSEGESLLSSGFCWPKTLELISGTPYLTYQRMGSGHIIGFTDDPNYRAMYPDLQRLFINAVIFGPGH